MYGWRARIGLIVPSSNTTMESEFWRLVPEGVSVHTARMSLVEVTPDALRKMAEDSLRAAEELATAEVDIIVYGCTTGSLLEGIEWENKLRESIEKRTGIKTVTTAQAVVEALRELKAKKVVIATPYIEELNQREKAFLESNGFEVLRIKGLGIIKNTEIGRQPPWVAYRLAKEVFLKDADAIFISCTNFRTIEIIEPLEQDLGKPVVSSNTASLWFALRALNLGISIQGYGRLLKGIYR
jgi:maleate isomerase